MDWSLKSFRKSDKRMIDTVVIHYPVTMSARASFVAMRDRGVSAHATLDRDGVVYNHVSWRDEAFHAGKSQWIGVKNINKNSLGVEIVNMGKMDLIGDAGWNDPNEVMRGNISYQKGTGDGAVHSYAPCVEVNGELWTEFTDEQYEVAGLLVFSWMIDTMNQSTREPTILLENVIGHEHVSAGRKFDPGPAFDWSKLYKIVISLVVNQIPLILDEQYKRPLRIKAIQSHLVRLGHSTKVDGILGDITKGQIESTLGFIQDSTIKTCLSLLTIGRN